MLVHSTCQPVQVALPPAYISADLPYLASLRTGELVAWGFYCQHDLLTGKQPLLQPNRHLQALMRLGRGRIANQASGYAYALLEYNT